MKLLITGAAGFIGSNLTHYWLEQHPADQVIALDALTYAGNRANLADLGDRVTFYHVDIRDQNAVTEILRTHRVDTVINAAAESHNSLAVLEPARFFQTNIMGTQALLDACRQAGVGRFHHISTCEVYGDLDLDAESAFTEESPYRPRTPYNASKAGADHAVRAYAETFGVPITITNCVNNFGPYQFPEKVIPLFITRAIDNLPLPIYSSSQNRREWIHVLDHCRAIDSVIHRGTVGDTYHVGTGIERTVTQLADEILTALDKPLELREVVSDRPGHDRRYVLDCRKITRALSWRPQVTFAEGLRKTVRWYVDNRPWWEPLLARSPVDERLWARTP